MLRELDRDVIYKLLGFTLAMVAAPISMYFLTVNTIFRGESGLAILLVCPVTDIMTRECYICRGSGSRDGQRGAVCVYHCGVA